MKFNPYQKVIIESYEGGEFAHLKSIDEARTCNEPE